MKFAPKECGVKFAAVLKQWVKIYELSPKFSMGDELKPVIVEVNSTGCNCIAWDPDSNSETEMFALGCNQEPDEN